MTPPRKKSSPARWTEEQVQLLLETVKHAPTARAAFHEVATQIGKSVGTVQQKYYALQRASGGSNASGRGRQRGAAAPSGRQRSAARGPELGAMSNVELARLVRNATAELERRMSELERNVRRLLG